MPSCNHTDRASTNRAGKDTRGHKQWTTGLKLCPKDYCTALCMHVDHLGSRNVNMVILSRIFMIGQLRA